MLNRQIASRLVVLGVLLVPAVAGARQTFKPAQLPATTFKTDAPAAPELSISIEPNRDLPATIKHVSDDQVFEARARSAKLTYTATGLSVELTAGTYTTRSGHWMTTPNEFESMQLEFSSNGRMVSHKATRR